jgi:RHS repeat-associated protein
VRYAHGAFGEERRVEVDLERPAAVQISTRGRDTIVVEMSEEISRAELEKALAAGGVVLSRTAISGSSTAKAAKSTIALTAIPAAEEGHQPRQRWIFTLAEPATPGEEVELAFDTGALVDGFLNTPEAITRFAFAWPASTDRTVIQDTTLPEVRQVGLVGGVLEVVLSEEPNLETASTALTLDGQPVAWRLSADGYALRTLQPLTPGDHELQFTTNPLDLAGNGLAAGDTLPFTWDGTTQLETLLTGTKRAEKSLLDDVAALNLGFQGQPFDPETGLYYFRNRYYDPELGRFISADPLGYVDGPSLYAFAGGDPVNGRDALGLETKEEWQALLKKDMKDRYGVDLDDWDPSKGFEHNREIVEAVYQWYSDMHREHEYMHWTGLAKMAGGRVWEGFQLSNNIKLAVYLFASRGWGERKLVEKVGVIEAVNAMQVAFLRINRDIFLDLAWHHKAFAEKGLAEIEERLAAGEIGGLPAQGWSLVNAGRAVGDEELVWAGNMLFAFDEQSRVVTPGYEDLRAISVGGVPLLSTMSQVANSPVPCGLPFREVAEPPVNIAGFWGQRWKWITDDMWPKWAAMTRSQRLSYTGLSLDVLVDRYPHLWQGGCF